MPTLPRQDRMCIEELLGMSSGYVMDLTNREFAGLVRDELEIDVEDSAYAARGTSKANRLRHIIETVEPAPAAQLLRALWYHREQRGWTPGEIVEPRPSIVRQRYMQVVERLERQANLSDTDALVAFADNATLDQLIEAINRDVAAGRHAAALDRLHTYCMKRFTYHLDEAGLSHVREEPLQSRVGKYVKWLIETRDLRPMTHQILKNAMGILQQFNDIRNNRSFAHDNDLIDAHEARLIFDTVVAILRFIEPRADAARS
ncbi:hypothetical protein C1T17_13850 [Sphingobium sp. SCG-1]|uniref:abortive infection family protein n=1 Tax=Sphingobium sp. SCG-1 TaxID=2072936 RepID=UPI000CD6803E|nr:abortive infection family protein [Sphingobium sp. SCG-1]AUW59017.1 hypothetical protein C1T17_13850 [Sphingobium sp. SCG-1]